MSRKAVHDSLSDPGSDHHERANLGTGKHVRRRKHRCAPAGDKFRSAHADGESASLPMQATLTSP